MNQEEYYKQLAYDLDPNGLYGTQKLIDGIFKSPHCHLLLQVCAYNLEKSYKMMNDKSMQEKDLLLGKILVSINDKKTMKKLGQYIRPEEYELMKKPLEYFNHTTEQIEERINKFKNK